MQKKMSCFLFNTLRLFLIMGSLSCSDFRKQSSDVPAPQLGDDTQLARFGIALAEKNTASFAQEAVAFRDQLQVSCYGLRPLRAYKNLLRSYYHLNAFAIAQLQPTPTEVPLSNAYSTLLNRCMVDVKVLEVKNKEALTEKLDPSIKGMNAIEYLLFDQDLMSRCNIKKYPQIATWNQLSDQVKRQDRCAAALSYADLLVQQAQQWEANWNPQSPTYNNTLQLFAYTDSAAKSVANMVHALSAIEKIKDFYLGEPLGLNALCTNEEGKCVDSVPHAFSKAGFLAIDTALEGFSQAFQGDGNSSDFSLATFIQRKNHPEIVEKINAAVADAEQMTFALQAQKDFKTWVADMDPTRCKNTTLENPEEPICVLFKKVELVTDIFKSDVLTLMSLELSTSLPQGDND